MQTKILRVVVAGIFAAGMTLLFVGVLIAIKELSPQPTLSLFLEGAIRPFAIISFLSVWLAAATFALATRELGIVRIRKIIIYAALVAVAAMWIWADLSVN